MVSRCNGDKRLPPTLTFMETHDTQAERDIFAAAAARPPEERAAYLDAACAELKK